MRESTEADIDHAVSAAAAACLEWGSSTADLRAAVFRGLAAALEADRDALVLLADQETGLGPVRLGGELARTAFQLRGFADLVSSGTPYAVLDDPERAGAPPLGRPHLTRVRVPLGPVAMFSASNFPFAFSVLGGDSASALAAGCPVIVKAHPGHPELSRRVYELTIGVLERLGITQAVMRMVEGATHAVGLHLVQHPDVAAVAFTGSLRGGLALQAAITTRPRPVPFYGELGSLNPVVILPAALQRDPGEVARELGGSIIQGAGQFCTKPGVIVLHEGSDAQKFLASLSHAMTAQPIHRLLTPEIVRGFQAATRAVAASPDVRILLPGSVTADIPTPLLAVTDAKTFVTDALLRDEVFGPGCIVVLVRSTAEVIDVLKAIGGSLTVTVRGASDDNEQLRSIVRASIRIAGRVLFAGVPTGVAVSDAQHHGGPWPSSTQAATTSVGYSALDRFLRPVALQSAPAWLLERSGRPL